MKLEALDIILDNITKRKIAINRFYFSTMNENNDVQSQKMFDNIDDVAAFLLEMSLTHGIFTTCLLKSKDISSILMPLKDYSKPEIDSETIDRFLKMKSSVN